jgi:hypothetical protein
MVAGLFQQKIRKTFPGTQTTAASKRVGGMALKIPRHYRLFLPMKAAPSAQSPRIEVMEMGVWCP